MVNTVVGQVFPWDLIDGGLIARSWVEAGVDEVAIATSYHSVRALSWNRQGRPEVIHQGSSAYYLPRISGARYPDLLPAPPAGLADDLFPRAVAIARQAGLETRAWLVLTHFDGIPQAASFATCIDLWGNRSKYAVCPNHPEVRAAGRYMVEDVFQRTGVSRFLAESIEPPGLDHSVAHDKLEIDALTPWQVALLSICQCAACVGVHAREGIDLASVASLLRKEFAALVPSPRAQDALTVIVNTRIKTSTTFIKQLSAPVGEQQIDLVVAATTQRENFGPSATLESVPEGTKGLLADLHEPDRDGWRDLEIWQKWPYMRRAGSMRAGTLSELHNAAQESRSHFSLACTLLDDLYLYNLAARPLPSTAELTIRAIKAEKQRTE